MFFFKPKHYFYKIKLLIVFYFIFCTCYSQVSTSPCSAVRLCETKSLNNSYPGVSRSYPIKSSCGTVTFSRTIFYRLIIKSGNKFTFKIKPKTSADYDWAVWKNINNCNNITTITPDRFSANAGELCYPQYTSNWDTGLDVSKPSSLVCQPANSRNDGLVAALDVNVGDEILLAIDLAATSTGVSNYLLAFGGNLGGGGNATFLCIEEYNPFYICDENNDNIEKNFDLNKVKENIIKEYLNGDINYEVKFYTNEKDLAKDVNSIKYIDVASSGAKVYCNIIKPNKDIYSSLSINLNLVKYPVGKDAEVTVCTDKIDLHVYDNLLSTKPDKTVFYYEILEKAQQEGEALAMPVTIQKTSTFYALIKTNKGGCSIIQKLTIQPFATPQVDPVTICSGNNVILTVKNPASVVRWYNVPTGGSPIYSGAIFSLGVLTNQKDNAISKDYYVEQENNNGCISKRVPVTVTVNPLPVVDLGKERIICQGDSVTLDAGAGFKNYLWSNKATSRTITVKESGTYTVTVTNGNCQGSGSVKVTVNPLPVVNLGTDRVICQGDSVTLDAGAGFKNYLWSNKATSRTITVKESGTYSVTVTNNNDCQGSGSVKVTVNPLPVVDLGKERIICQGDSVTLDAGAGFKNYRWSNNATGRIITVKESGTYSVTVTNNNDCEGSSSVKVTVNPLPVVDLGKERIICQGDSVTLDAGAGFKNYRWNNNATGRIITVKESGTYSVTVTNNNDCEGSGSVKVTVNPLPVVDLGKERIICQGDSVTLDAGAGFKNYRWSNNTTGRIITVKEAGTYSVTVTNNNDCEGSGSVKVTVNPLPVVDLGKERIICQGDSVTLDAGAGFKNYLWSNNATSRTIKVKEAGTYSVTVTNNNDCEGSGSVKVTVNPLPVVDLGKERIICQGDSVTLDAGAGFKNYRWNNNATSQTIKVKESGTYSVTVTNNNDCEGSGSVKVTVNPLPVVDLGTDRVICQGDSVTLDAGAGFKNYRWSNNATGRIITVKESGTYSVTVTNNNDCEGSGSVKVTVNPLPVVNLGTDRVICQGDSVTLDAGARFKNYRWSNGATTQTITVSTAGTYSVTVTNENDCEGTGFVDVTVNPLPEVDLGSDQTLCKGSTVTLDAGNVGSSYLWSNGATTQMITVSESGTYYVTVTNENECSITSSSVEIDFYTPFIKEVKVTENKAEVIAIGNGALEYSLDLINWQSSPIFYNLKFEVYKAYVRNSFGCISDPYTFGMLNIPNVITPNGDGINDVWNLKGLELYPGSLIRIFNRYGKLLVNTKYEKGFVWDGTYLGRKVATDSYWYMIELTDGRKLTGWIVVRNYNEN